MKNELKNIRFDRNKGPAIDFDIVTLEGILSKTFPSHDPKSMHRVDFYVMMIITSGSGKHTIDFIEYDYAKGSIITIRKNQIHRFHGGSAKGFMILFTEEYVLSFLDQKGSEKIARFFNELMFQQHTHLSSPLFKEVTLLISQIQAEYHQSIDDHTSAIIRNYLQVLISKVYRLRDKQSNHTADNSYSSRFLKFQSLVELHCKSERNVQFYADQLNTTTRTLNNITHALVQKSAKVFIDEIAILQIKRLLLNTALSVKEIAYQSGFNEPTNLFKFFKRSTGQTPEVFRSSFV